MIENKIKSLPNEEQLNNYKKALEYDIDIKKVGEKNNKKFTKKYEFICGVVTGIEKPNFIDECNGWLFLTYGEIGRKIKNILNEVQNALDNFDKIIIEKYADLLINLQEVLESCCNEYGERLVDNSKNNKVIKLFEDIKFDDVIKKLQADKFLTYLTKNLKQELENMVRETDYKLYIWSSYNNKKATIDIRYVKDDKTTNERHIGIQIEGGQYRHSCQMRGDEISCDYVFDKFKESSWLVKKDDIKNKQIKFGNYNKSLTTGMRLNPGYCKYEAGKGNDKYHHVYQYYYIEDFSFARLSEQIKKDMEYAAQLIRSKKID